MREAMNAISTPDTRFIGYGLRRGRAMGSLVDVPEEQIVETPVAENLMVGLAMGLSLMGRKPVVFFERFDFVLNAVDAIVNHLDKMNTISDGLHNPTAILRVVVGNSKNPLFTGITHTQDFTDAFIELVDFPVITLDNPMNDYLEAFHNLPHHSTMIVEYKDEA